MTCLCTTIEHALSPADAAPPALELLELEAGEFAFGSLLNGSSSVFSCLTLFSPACNVAFWKGGLGAAAGLDAVRGSGGGGGAGGIGGA